MGTVYKAHDPQLDRTVALKLPRFDGPAEGRTIRIQRFHREARIASQLADPHIVVVHDFGIDAVLGPYLVIEHLKGQ